MTNVDPRAVLERRPTGRPEEFAGALRVPADFVIDVSYGFKLESRMLHVEVTGETVLEVVEDPTHLAPSDAVVSDHDMRRENREGRGQRPCVQVMYRGHLAQFEKVPAYLLEVDVLRGGLQEHVERRPKELERSLQHEGHHH
jgi:hypothetical protein